MNTYSLGQYSSSMGPPSAFKRDILWTIALFEGAGEQPCGSRIQEVLESFYQIPIHNGRFYPNLTELRDAGYVEKHEIDGRANEYPLTDAGREWVYIRGGIVVEIMRLNGQIEASGSGRRTPRFS